MDDDTDTEYATCKVVLLGEAGVGKTSIISRYVSNTFSDVLMSTTGASFATKKVELDDGTVGIVSNTNTLDKTKPVVVDLNGNPVPDDILIVGNYTGDITEKKVAGL